MISRRSLASVLAAATAIGLAGVPDSTAQEKKTLRLVMHAPLRITDPIITTAYIIRNHGYFIYDTLFAMDANPGKSTARQHRLPAGFEETTGPRPQHRMSLHQHFQPLLQYTRRDGAL